ncbi:MAG: hypothetical protein J2O48_02265 [Solirubrobacterales bacterium]|nr:hypothetical protein [Solirubrobacterales bacterium]
MPDTPNNQNGRAARIAALFDIRLIIGGLFLTYGIILVITGLAGSHTVKTKAAGINIDLWGGLVMIVFALGMATWARLGASAAHLEHERKPE